jgi:hypothetical protein
MGLIQSIFAVFTLIAGGVSIMLVVSTKTLRDSRDDLEKRVKQLEDERTRDKAAIAEKDTAIGFWRSAATGDEKLDHLIENVLTLSVLLTEHHDEAKQNWILVNAGLQHVGSGLDHLSESVDSAIETLGDTT